MTYDETDKKLIAALREASDRRLVDYSSITSIPKSTVHERLRKLVEGGVRCIPIIRWPQLGFPIVAYFFVPYRKQIAEYLCVNTALRLSPNTLFIECVFSSIKEAEAFKEKLRATRYFTAIEVLKQEGFIPPING